MLLVLLLLADQPAVVPAAPLPPAEAARRAALAHFAAGRLQAGTDRPASAAKELEAAQKADPAAAEPKRELVRVYAGLGRDAAAIRTANAVLAADPHDFTTARRLGRLLFEGKRFKESAAALKQAADSPRLDAAPADRLADLRECATASGRAGDWAGAEAALSRAVKLIADRRADLRKSPRFETDAELDAEAADVQEQLGAALTGTKAFAAADAAYREAARLFTACGDRVRAARLGWNRAAVLAAAGKPADAATVMGQFLDLKPTTLAPYRQYADWLRAAGRGGDAPGLLAGLAERHPGEPRIRWVQAAETLRQNPAAGGVLFEPHLEKSADPDLWRLYVQAATAARRADVIVARLNRLSPPRGDDESAAKPDPATTDRLRALTAAVKAEPDLPPLLLAEAATARDWPPDTWALVAFLAERDGQAADAETALRRGLAADSDLFDQLYRLLGRQRRWRDVVALCEQMDGRMGPGGRRRGPPLLGYYQAMPLAELGREQEALQAIDAAVPNAPRPLVMRLEKARVLSALGRHELALAECDAVAAIAGPADLREARIQKSQVYLGLRDFAASERELRAVLEDDPDDALALNNLGYHLADEGRELPEAEGLIRRAVELERAERTKRGFAESESGTYLDSLAWVRFKRGDLAGAKALFERAVGLPDAAADATVWDHLGDVRFRLGDLPGAKAAWRKADELYTDTRLGRQSGRQNEVRRKLRRVP